MMLTDFKLHRYNKQINARSMINLQKNLRLKEEFIIIWINFCFDFL